MLVFRAELMYVPKPVGGARGGGDKIRIGGAHMWAEMLHHPCILRDPQQRGQSQTKKKQKNKNKNFPMVSLILPTVLQTDSTGF